MSIKIRNANRRDTESLVRINRELTDFYRRLHKYWRSDKKTEDAFRKFFLKNIKTNNYRAIVAENKGKIIGYVTGEIITPGIHTIPKRIGNVYGLFVLGDYRKQGIGKRLFAELIKWFRKKKIKNIEANVDLKNKLGIKVWKKLGFKEIQKIMLLKL